MPYALLILLTPCSHLPFSIDLPYCTFSFNFLPFLASVLHLHPLLPSSASVFSLCCPLLLLSDPPSILFCSLLYAASFGCPFLLLLQSLLLALHTFPLLILLPSPSSSLCCLLFLLAPLSTVFTCCPPQVLLSLPPSITIYLCLLSLLPSLSPRCLYRLLLLSSLSTTLFCFPLLFYLHPPAFPFPFPSPSSSILPCNRASIQ